MKNKQVILFLLAIMSITSFKAAAIVFGNAKTLSKYGNSVVIEIEVFNLYDFQHKDIDIQLLNFRNKESKNKYVDVKFEQSFIQSNGLGWITIVTKDKIYKGSLEFILSMKTDKNQAKRQYNLTFYGDEKNRPIKTCNINTKRMKCLVN